MPKSLALSLLQNQPGKIPPMMVLFGGERYLKVTVLDSLVAAVFGDDDDARDAGLARFEGKQTDLKTVRDELLTISMFGERRMVIVDDADDFISAHRAGLEKYVESPAKRNVLVLSAKSFAANTRLFKAVVKNGLVVDCSPLKDRELVGWLVESAREEHNKQLTRDAAHLMVELAGSSLGLLAQELSKLAAYVGDRSRIGVDDVRTLVGGWKAETTWVMIGALLEGRTGLALECLDKLLAAREAPEMILGGIVSSFRKLAEATERARQGERLSAALKSAGVFDSQIVKSAAYLRRIGRPRAEQLLLILLSAQEDLKGRSRMPREMQMELLIARLSVCPEILGRHANN